MADASKVFSQRVIDVVRKEVEQKLGRKIEGRRETDAEIAAFLADYAKGSSDSIARSFKGVIDRVVKRYEQPGTVTVPRVAADTSPLRSRILRIAAGLPAGNPTRRKILNALQE